MAVATTGAETVEWDLTDLYAGADDPALARDMDEAKRAAQAFHARYASGVPTLAPAGLAEAAREFERLTALSRRFAAYAQLRFDADTADDENARLLARTREAATAVETDLLFFELEWAAVADADADEKLAAPELERHRHALAVRRRFREHLLSEAEERIVAEKALTGQSAWERLYTDLLSQIRVEFDGATLSIDEARDRLRTLPARENRARLADAITAGLQPNLRLRGFVLNTIAADRAVEDRLRGFPTWISSRNLVNEISDGAVDALIEAVTTRYDIPQRQFALRARMLGIDRLADYDRFAPIRPDRPAVTWDEARELVTDAYDAFTPEAGRVVGRFFDERWIDAAVRPAKSPGAYCAMRVPDAHPYILMSYAGTRDSLLTLAHELGHGLHAVLCNDLGYLDTEIPLTIVETGSVFGEALAFDAMLERAHGDDDRLDLLVARIDGAVATVFGTITWNRFEDAAHNARREEGELPLDRLNELCGQAWERLHGDVVETTPGYRSWWSYVPHFVAVPGYMYAYAFGYLLSLALYRRYRADREALVKPILEFLRLGGSRSPAELASVIGFDLDDPSLWHDGLAAIDDLVAEAESLAAAD